MLPLHRRPDLCRSGWVSERGRFYGWFGPWAGPWTIATGEITDEDEIVCTPIARSKAMRMTLVRGSLLALTELVGLGPDGKVSMLADGALHTERVCTQARTRELGSMNHVANVGDALYAVGQGGQVYTRDLDTPWRPVGEERPELSGHAAVMFGSIVRQHDRVLVGGRHVRYPGKAAKKQVSSTAKRADTILGSVRRDEPGVWVFDGTAWTPIRHEMVGAREFFLLAASGDHVLVLAKGHVYKTVDFTDFTELFALPPTLLVDRETTPTGELFLLSNEPLKRFGTSGLIDAAPAWPDDSFRVGLSVVVGRTFVTTSDALLELRDGTWHRRALRAPAIADKATKTGKSTKTGKTGTKTQRKT